MASNDDAWGDLFAKAGSHDEVNDGNIDDRDTKNETVDKPSKRSKKRKRDATKRSANSGGAGNGVSSAASAAFLEARMHVPLSNNTMNDGDKWRDWISLGPSIFGSYVCGQWTSRANSHLCSHCSKSKLFHVFSIPTYGDDASKHMDQSWPLLAFLSLRNIRVCATATLLGHAERLASPSSSLLSDSSAVLSSSKPFLWRSVVSAEAQLLENKLSDVLRHATLLLEALPSRKHRSTQRAQASLSRKLLEKAFRLIMACDAFYYRLYYVECLDALPKWKPQRKSPSELPWALPHPARYFGLDGWTVDMPMATHAWECVHQRKWKEQEPRHHVLEWIYHARQKETAWLFEVATAWTGWQSTHQEVMTALVQTSPSDPETKHETPAPKILVEWRDSCRDFLCNLYAYATISTEALGKIQQTLQRLALSRVLEIGAGTGYLAKLLSENGNAPIQVDAWDIDPPGGAMNEYHGQTPTFFRVQRSSKFPTTSCADTALLLCYPPPDLPMAYDTLQQYLSAGGKCLIHVGEFKGLTGDRRFEKKLLKGMECIERYSNPSWGTDASHVTIWKKRGETMEEEVASDSTSRNLLIPCSQCGQVEATKRCRLWRCLAYCSADCCELHEQRRMKLLRRHMVQVTPDALGFHKAEHFCPL
eukprot:Nitzschia sp. Nitz4//scaffold165_size50357//16911//18851//NITZ4_007019-RA/size50357-processed-gene-0.48-mRNA-1//1//CDS//3329538126//220//frame0